MASSFMALGLGTAIALTYCGEASIGSPVDSAVLRTETMAFADCISLTEEIAGERGVGIATILQGTGSFGIYFALFGLAAIFMFSGVSVLPTARNNKKAIMERADKAQQDMAGSRAASPSSNGGSSSGSANKGAWTRRSHRIASTPISWTYPAIVITTSSRRQE